MRWLAAGLGLLGLLALLLAPRGAAHAARDAGADGSAAGELEAMAGELDPMPGELTPRELDPMPPELHVTAHASVAEVMLGVPFSVIVTVAHPPGVDINLPAALLLGDTFEPGRRSSARRTRADGVKLREFEIEVVAWEVGDVVIPPIPVTHAVAGTVHIVHTQPIPLHVIGLVGEGREELRDIRAPVAVLDSRRSLAYIAVVLLGVLAAILAARRVRRARRRPGPALPAPRPPADREALDQLQALAASGALQAEDRKPAFLAMSAIMRAYLARRFGIPAGDATTAEIKAMLAERAEARPLCADIEPWLDRCDLVKYAGALASADDAQAILDDARDIITSAGASPAAARAASAGASPAAARAAASARPVTEPRDA